MLKKAVSIFMVVVMLLSMSITSVVFADVAGKGSELTLNSNVGNADALQISQDSFNNAAAGFAGKKDADTVAKITLNKNSGTLPLGDKAVGGAYPRYDITHDFNPDNGTGLTSNFTFQANIYADGEAVVGIASHWNDFFRWDKDGKLYAIENTAVNYEDQYKVNERHIATLDRGRWHTFALTICTDQVSTTDIRDYMVHKLYIDGEYVDDVTRIFRKLKHNAMRIGAYKGSGAGEIAIDDAYAYAGAYDATNEVVAPVSNAELTIDSAAKTIICTANAFDSAESFNEAVKTAFDANYAILYDAALTTPATAFAYGVVAINSKNGIGYDYYTVADKLPVDVKMQIEEDFNDAAIDTTKLAFDNYDGDFAFNYQGGLGGKSLDDKALVISAVDATLVSPAEAGKEPKIKLAGTGGYNDDIVTVEADIYKNDIATETRVYMRYTDPNKGGDNLRWQSLVKFEMGGNITIDGKTIDIGDEDVMTYKPNRWYKVAVTFDRAKHGFDVYINGKSAGFIGIPTANQCTAVANVLYVAGVYNGLNENTNATTISTIQLDSITAVDNFRVYLSAYVPADDAAAITVGSGLSLSVDTIIAEDYALLTAKQVMDAVTAPAVCEIYADSACSSKLGDNDKITANSVLVSKSQSGEVFEYYRFNGGVGNIDFEVNANKITASVDATAPYMFIIAEYNGSNELLNIFVSEELDFAQINNVTIDYTAGNTYKAFVWTANHVPVRYVAY